MPYADLTSSLIIIIVVLLINSPLIKCVTNTNICTNATNEDGWKSAFRGSSEAIVSLNRSIHTIYSDILQNKQNKHRNNVTT